jgi:quinol monooxygenase YgiN
MAVVLITYAPSREAYDALADETGREAPPGCIVHTASEHEGRVRVVDVWESREAIDEFFQSTLGPAFAKFGIEADPPELTETFNVERG